MIKDDNFIVIQGFMINKLNLKGTELLVYAIIYGFSQDGKNKYTGSIRYLATWCNTTKPGIHKVLKKLLEKKLIEKEEIIVNNIKFVSYRVVNKVYQGSTKFTGVVNKVNELVNKVYQSSKQSLSNNINNNINNINNINNNNDDKRKEIFEYDWLNDEN